MNKISKSKIKVVILARYGSSRLSGKPLLLLCGKPIFWHVYQRAFEAGVLPEDIVVATDRLNEVATQLGGMMRH